jgi:rubrerythrin
MSKTQDDLKAAFAGESQANRKYLAFAKKAEEEGKKNLAKLFRATAEGETVHALKHLGVMGDVKDSAQNLKAAISGETYEIETMYPGFIADAQEEDEKMAVMTFDSANKVEKVHQEKYAEALKKVEAGEDIEEKEYYVCSVCGNLFDGELPDNCPICNAPKEKFVKID